MSTGNGEGVRQRWYSGIGSRATPEHVLAEMRSIGRSLAERGFILRSGGADGADMAFERGCDEVNGPKEIFLPWKKFNKNGSPLYTQLPEAFEIAATLHPAWPNLKDIVRKLMARNVHQVLGVDLQHPCDFVVCWTSFAQAVGGTALAMNLAKREGIPVYNLADGSQREKLYFSFGWFQ